MQTINRTIERWGIYEVTLDGPIQGNPFTDVQFRALFKHKNRAVEADGFYDGDGQYRLRFMPDEEGNWSYVTRSSLPELDAIGGEFICAPAGPGNHGPVRVLNGFHFAYEDGTPYAPVGTTCYVWNHQGDALEAQTLETLKSAPFNKMRMCVFPKDYAYNKNEPPLHPFEGSGPGQWDFTRFNPAYFRRLEQRIGDLMALGIEADLILFHPYDRWGYSQMPAEVDDRYLRYVVARLWAYRNVWWSMANEYDFMPAKSLPDWDRFFRIVQESDPAQHLRSVHNGHRIYDYAKPWVTHSSIQHHEIHRVVEWREQYRKPVVIDECGYEGNIQYNWGNLTARELVHRFWMGFCQGGYVGHGETYLHPEEILWWSKGGVLHGESPERIAFLRRIIEEGPAEGLEPQMREWNTPFCAGRAPDYYLLYLGEAQPAIRDLNLPDGYTYQIEVIDAWEMTITPLDGTYSGRCQVRLPGKPYQALRIRKAGEFTL